MKASILLGLAALTVGVVVLTTKKKKVQIPKKVFSFGV
jgi:hypothetical protein